MFNERAFTFDCQGSALAAILHPAESKVGILVVVGGPQYRIGSHRQFLHLARFMASKGVPVMRFDYRGMGDSQGAMRDFEQIGDDLAEAIKAFFQQQPGLERVILFGLCDAASASLFYAHQDERVAGLVLLNPWVRTEAGEAKAFVKHYYAKRFLSGDFWKKLLSGRVNLFASLADGVNKLRASQKPVSQNSPLTGSLPERMRQGLSRFSGPRLLLMSGNDLTAREFDDTIEQNQDWQALLAPPATKRVDLPEANHTFSSARWRAEVNEAVIHWYRQHFV